MDTLAKRVIEAACREVAHSHMGYMVAKSGLAAIGKDIGEEDGGSWEYNELRRAVNEYEAAQQKGK